MPATLARGWRDRLVGIARAALPQACALCAAPAGLALLCPGCVAALPRLPAACPCCALPTPHGASCGRCLAQPPAFFRSEAAFVYAFPLDRLVQALKYHGTLAYAGWFAEALLAMLSRRGTAPAGDALIPMPLSRARQRERGFNQALEVARPLARWTGIPLAADAAIRIRDTPPQAALPWAERGRNIRGAFACPARLDGQRVIVIDDVMTTGASLEEFARTLRAAGAVSVENWVIARTPSPSDG